MDASKEKRSTGPSRAKRRLHKAVEEIYMVPVNQSQDEIRQMGDHLLVIREKLLLELQPYAAKLDEDELTFIRRAIEQRVEFVKRGASSRSTFTLETPGRDDQHVQFV